MREHARGARPGHAGVRDDGGRQHRPGGRRGARAGCCAASRSGSTPSPSTTPAAATGRPTRPSGTPSATPLARHAARPADRAPLLRRAGPARRLRHAGLAPGDGRAGASEPTRAGLGRRSPVPWPARPASPGRLRAGPRPGRSGPGGAGFARHGSGVLSCASSPSSSSPAPPGRTAASRSSCSSSSRWRSSSASAGRLASAGPSARRAPPGRRGGRRAAARSRRARAARRSWCAQVDGQHRLGDRPAAAEEVAGQEHVDLGADEEPRRRLPAGRRSSSVP